MDDKTKNDDDIRPLSPEEIKAIGEIEIGPSKHEIFLNTHYRKLMWGGIGLSVAAACVIAWFSYRNDHRNEAAAQAMQVFKVSAPGSAAHSAAYDTAAMQALTENYADTPSATAAELLKALSQLTGENSAAALATLEQLADTAQNPLIAARAQAAIASHYTREGKEKEATAAWQKLVQMGDSPYQALGYLTLGDMTAAAGDKKAARGYYEQARTKCETSALVTGKTVEMRLILLDVDAPRPVAPLKATSEQKPADALNPFGAEPEQTPPPAADDPFGITSPAQPGEGPLGPVMPTL
ncbi:MAG: tetratricopeptide repeat protein [Akkermansia sp.]|nr:tetratricopeptide repeat protein [Akkermansia sp.]